MVAERCIDLAEIGDFEQDQRQRWWRYGPQQFLQRAFRVHAVRQSGERIVMCVMTDARLAFGDVLLHDVEGGRKTAELITAAHIDGLVVGAGLDALRRTHQFADGTRGTAAEQQRDGEGAPQRDAADGDQRVALGAIGGHHRVHRFLQHDGGGLSGITQP